MLLLLLVVVAEHPRRRGGAHCRRSCTNAAARSLRSADRTLPENVDCV